MTWKFRDASVNILQIEIQAQQIIAMRQ